ncbi:C40 family peptidase [Candidatus Chloroploca sp. M-50]|uniref:C40 family peptidase n=1 Tax=Candidatus Chloroploca mongolica TaxID=2528176 RepID=A0ABS4DBA2_9CHLR|nr:C40 family peptidase [Candidatus Chloroploca mongolica]MBP1466726.1 C40 family peptidase [Candidatus Chloroploca mongolica]
MRTWFNLASSARPASRRSPRWPCSRRGTWLGLLALLLTMPTILACTSGLAITQAPRWACPSPTPLPYGETGPVKEVIRHTRPVTEGGDWDEQIFYELWEQEYPEAAGRPFPSPTPYAKTGRAYVFGQRVEIWPFHVLVTASAGPEITRASAAANAVQLYHVTITWVNHTVEAVPINYAQQVRLRALTTPTGQLLSQAYWGVTAEALSVSALPVLPTTIPPGESSVQIPILGPVGTPHTVELEVATAPVGIFLLPTTTTLPGLPTSTPQPTLTPTPRPLNTGLHAPGRETVTVQWSNARWVPPGAEPCLDPGALTDWDDGRANAAAATDLIMPAPPGASRVVQLALAQVGKPYIWGAKGPEAFDCSGLMTWVYAQIGLRIPHGTAGQWPGMQPVDHAALQPGDLVFFAIAGGRIDHVGMLVGDLNGNGRWDMVHAASPGLGVRVDYDIFESPYYAPRIRGMRTAR